MEWPVEREKKKLSILGISDWDLSGVPYSLRWINNDKLSINCGFNLSFGKVIVESYSLSSVQGAIYVVIG